MPVSGQLGIGLKDSIPEHLCNWYSGPPFIPFIDSLPSLNRKSNGPFIMPIVDKYKDMGTVVMGKVEAGEAKKGQSLLVMPNRVLTYFFICKTNLHYFMYEFGRYFLYQFDKKLRCL